MQQEEKAINHENFEKNFFKSIESKCFYKFAEKQISLMQGRFALGTILPYNSELSKLKKFRNPLLLENMDTDFLKRYEYYMFNHSCPNFFIKT